MPGRIYRPRRVLRQCRLLALYLWEISSVHRFRVCGVDFRIVVDLTIPDSK